MKKALIKKTSKKLSLGQKLGLAATVAVPTAFYVGSGGFDKDKKMKTEMQKIAKERRAGKKFTRKEINKRLGSIWAKK